MKPVKVSDLSGPALDWAVAKCEGLIIKRFVSGHFYVKGGNGVFCYAIGGSYSPSSDWSLAGPIIEREGIGLDFSPADMGDDPACEWAAYDRAHAERENGPTPLVAAMRCYVASKLGDTVEIPKELI